MEDVHTSPSPNGMPLILINRKVGNLELVRYCVTCILGHLVSHSADPGTLQNL